MLWSCPCFIFGLFPLPCESTILDFHLLWCPLTDLSESPLRLREDVSIQRKESQAGREAVKCPKSYGRTVGYGRIGRLDKAAAVLAELRKLGREHYVSVYDIATVYAGMGERGDAIKTLRQAAAEHAFWLIALPVEPLFDTLRDASEFEPVLKTVWAGVPRWEP